LPTQSQPLRAIVVADGDVPPAEELAALLADPVPPLVIAADGGLRKAEQLGLRPDVVVGDGDSLAPARLAELVETGVECHLHPADKDASDTELALRLALARGASRIVVLGALGGLRFEHALANVLLLALPELVGCAAELRDGRTVVRLIEDGGSLELRAGDGRLVSLLPLSEVADGVTTHGLRFPLHNEPLKQGPSRGLSNELVAEIGLVTLRRGRLVVVQTSLGGN
jgi:thiamine pyrophosphokinase